MASAHRKSGARRRGAVWSMPFPSSPVVHGGHAFFMGAMRAAINVAAGLGAVTDYLAAAMFAFRGQVVDGAFETIVVVRDAVFDDFKRFVVFVSAYFTTIHKSPFSNTFHAKIYLSSESEQYPPLPSS